jgi:arsenite-activated ATPase (arsA)
VSRNASSQVVLFGGKGGVGKTTCASATALKLAQQGSKTLLVSTDPAHSTSDIFDTSLGDEPTAINNNLHGVEIVPKERFNRRYSEKLQGILERANDFGLDIGEGDLTDVTADGLIPGTDELAVIDVFAEYVGNSTWDTVVFDTAPTGHTLRVLQLPDVAGTALSKAAKLKSGIDSVTSAASRVFGGGGESSESGLNISDDIATAQSQIETVAEIIEDAERTRFNIVTHAEDMAIAETKRLYQELHDAQVPVGYIIANKVRIDINEDCHHCVAQQQQQLALLEEFERDIGVSTHRIPATPEMSDIERVQAIAEDIPLAAKPSR